MSDEPISSSFGLLHVIEFSCALALPHSLFLRRKSSPPVVVVNLAMAASASLVELCGRAMAELANRDAAKCQELFLLPSHLLAHIIPLLSPVALESLQTKPDFKLSFEESCGRSHSKQQSNLKRTFDAMMDGCSLCCLNGAWKKHFDKRWPAGGFRKLRFEFLLSPTEIMLLNLNDDEDLIDWRQRFWETHVQECLNEAVARISTSHHQGSLYKINLSNHLLRVIGYAVENSATSCSATCCLEYICCKFGAHIRYLRLRGSLCTMELSTLLSSCTELQHVVCSHIDTAIQVEGLCLLLNQKRGRLQILEFQNCRFSECGLLKIKGSLMASDYRLLLRHLFVHSSQTLLIRSSEYFLRFLQSCSYLQSLVLIDNQVDLATVSDLLSMIVTRMPHLSLFHVRENELTGLALPFPSSFHTNNLSSLKALDVRSNNINLQDLEEFLPYFDFMPSLKLLNISDNPIGDDGLIALLPVLQGLQLSELSLSACNLSMKGVCSLFDVIISSDHSLRSLSISQNFLSSSIAAPLANFLRFGMVERLDLGEIGLGMDGCLALQSALNKMPRLSHFILRKNRIGSAGAALISKLVATPNALKEIDLSSNLLDKQCLQSVASYLESLQGGMLELVDLRNNLAEESKIFENIKKPQVLLSEVGKFYDDDP